ncbi:MAG TPA: RidA family protein [Bauldia sp.]|nr:RidA family protein [Bauldia sp.]
MKEKPPIANKRERRNGLVHAVLQPAGWPAPSGYVNGVAAKGRMVFTGGLVGWDSEGAFPAGIVAQIRQTLRNALAVLAEAGAGPEHIVRMTWYVTDIAAYIAARKEIGAAYVEVVGRHYPPMALVEVRRLVEQPAMVEIEVTAVVPE